MSALAAGDAERLLRFVADAESHGGDHPVTPELLAELGTLVRADWIAYAEVDWVRQEQLLEVERPGDGYDVPDWEQLSWRIADVHPLIQAHQQGHFGAHRMSDFFSTTELRRSRVYEWMQLYKVEHVINLAIPSPVWNTMTFLFDRVATSSDFSERDRLVLNLLQPHLARLLRAGRTRRLLKAALADLDRPATDVSHGVALLGTSNEIEFISPRASRLLRTYFGTEKPRALARWLERSEGPLVRTQRARRLTIRRTGETLLLEEHDSETELTTREKEILSWVARGKTNAEIAQLLWIAPSTVRKHLENVYAKLGVSTRTAAVARVFGSIGAEAS